MKDLAEAFDNALEHADMNTTYCAEVTDDGRVLIRLPYDHALTFTRRFAPQSEDCFVAAGRELSWEFYGPLVAYKDADCFGCLEIIIEIRIPIAEAMAILVQLQTWRADG